MDAKPALREELASLFSEISETAKRADDAGYPFGGDACKKEK